MSNSVTVTAAQDGPYIVRVSGGGAASKKIVAVVNGQASSQAGGQR